VKCNIELRPCYRNVTIKTRMLCQIRRQRTQIESAGLDPARCSDGQRAGSLWRCDPNTHIAVRGHGYSQKPPPSAMRPPVRRLYRPLLVVCLLTAGRATVGQTITSGSQAYFEVTADSTSYIPLPNSIAVFNTTIGSPSVHFKLTAISPPYRAIRRAPTSWWLHHLRARRQQVFWPRSI
jgi:hypothetical protein